MLEPLSLNSQAKDPAAERVQVLGQNLDQERRFPACPGRIPTGLTSPHSHRSCCRNQTRESLPLSQCQELIGPGRLESWDACRLKGHPPPPPHTPQLRGDTIPPTDSAHARGASRGEGSYFHRRRHAQQIPAFPQL